MSGSWARAVASLYVDRRKRESYPRKHIATAEPPLRKLIRRLKSLKLTVFLLAYIALSCVLATLVPQRREAEFYTGSYPRLVAQLILGTGFSDFFRSMPFMLPASLLFANLSACTISRSLREFRKKGGRRHGPDILHVGLMLLGIGALLSFSGRREYYVDLATGDYAELPDGRRLRLDRFEFLRYDDGRPKQWTSEVSVFMGDTAEVEAYPIRVNHPLKLGRLSVYQVSYSIDGGLSGLEAVVDPGFPLVATALLLVGAGSFLAIFQKLKDMEA